MKVETRKKIISFTGYSGSGKTTFIVKLIAELKSRGLDIAVIKHDAHEFQIDTAGKDTALYSEAGADVVGIFSKTRAAVYGSGGFMLPYTFEELPDRTYNVLNEFIDRMPQNVDVYIVEGCRDSSVPKIGFSRKATGKGMSLPADQLIAVITDEDIEHDVKFGIEDIKGVADFIISYEEHPEYCPRKDQDFERAVTVNEGLKILDSVKVEPQTEFISAYDACGRILAQDCAAENDFPPFRRSPLDGYAFKASDTSGADREHPVTLKITEEIPAGSYPTKVIESGYAAKILTGAPIPDGADAVEKYEVCEFTDETVKIFSELKHNDNIVPQGEDYKKGDILVRKGEKIDPFNLGVLSMLGMSRVPVYRKPKVTIISSGSELVDVDESVLLPGKIRNSSMFTIASIAEAEGADVVYGGIVKDEIKVISDAMARAAEGSDIVITTGGVSAGDYDLIVDAMKNIGARILFWKAKMKPGMAVACAASGGTIFLGLSGNPSAAAVSMDVFGRMLIRKLSGLKNYMPQTMTLRLKGSMNKKSPRGRYIRGNLAIENGEAWFVPSKVTGNGTTSANQGTDLLGIVPPGTESMNTGDLIESYYVG